MSPHEISTPAPPLAAARRAPEVVLALDVPGAAEALALAERIPEADFVKVGLQLFTAAGPRVVRDLRAAGRRIFLDLKLHDIPTTVAHAVAAAAALGVELLTVHAVGGTTMLRAASAAAGGAGEGGPRLLAVTVLTSLTAEGLGEVWGRRGVDAAVEVARLAALSRDAGVHGVVASVRELAAIRACVGDDFRVLTPGIRLPGDAAGDQARVATPAEAARLGADYLVIGRSVTTARDPRDAFRRVRAAAFRAV